MGFENGNSRGLQLVSTSDQQAQVADDDIDDLPEFRVSESQINQSMIDQLAQAIEPGCTESSAQKILEKFPYILAQYLGGGHGRWVIPQKRLGSEFVTDFLIGERNSGGYLWHAVELESPQVPLFTKKGDPSQHLTHAYRQITDWRNWLVHNQNYAARPRSQNGLGLSEIRSDLHGMIIIGRRSNYDSLNNPRRRQFSADWRTEIMTYDRLLEWAQTRADHWSQWHRSFAGLLFTE